MKTSFDYRSYVVSNDGAVFTAAASDEEPFQLRSKSLVRVTRAIDAMWNALEGKIPMPSWMATAGDIIDIDAAASGAVLVRVRIPVEPAIAKIRAVA
ncbi:hypothetical protein [Bradyrhizobium sp. SZCCHNR3118]|uniref:hypothetical protein n=1 Tax=Bradyrhizobium sp. SZCCHNR3118 TaxID=3057468 RepID=UPI002916F3EB|nr:hypothetical protein [Bradyrhizobium sp. SZCCHNR3118]